MRKKLMMLGLMAAAAWSGGCTYAVRVRNDNGQPLAVRLVQKDPLMKDWVLDEHKVLPGEVVELGPTSRVMKSHIYLEANPTHGGGVEPARRAVLPGRHAFTVGVEEGALRLGFSRAEWGELIP